MKIKKIIATLLAMCMILSCVGVIPAKAASEVDVTNDITMENRGTGWSSDTTYIKIGFGGRSTIETKAGSTYYVNDHADQATIDPAEYIYVNDKSVRSHISGYTSSVIGTNFPMNLGTLYNPICMYVDSTSIKIYVLNSYLTNGTFSVTVKGGFTWENTSGEVLSVKEDVTFGYASGAWGKQDEPTTGPSEGPSEDGSIDVTDLIAMKDTGTAYSADTTSIEVSFGDYSVTEASVGESYYVNTHGQDTPLDPAEYFYINDKSIRDHINDYSDKTTLGSAFPMSEDIRYNPICMYVSNGSKCFKLYVLDSYLEKESYSITVKAGFRWTNVNGETLVVNKDVTYHYANGELVKLGEEPKEIDVTDEVFMNDFGTVISSDTTTISISLGEHKVAPASGDGTYCPNDHPTTNGVDVAEYILVNGQSVRSHLKTYEESGSDIRGSAFPMSAGIKYNPILVYCDADSNFFRISVLTSYLPRGEFEVVLKAGFTWKNVDGENLVVKKNVTFSYVDGVFQKNDQASVRDITDAVVMKDAGSGISSDTTTITISPGSYDMTPASGDSTYCVNDHAGTNGIDVAQYILVNGKSVRDHIGDYKESVLGTAFPMNLGAQYNPILVYCEAECGYFRISILNSYLEKGTYEVTLKKGFTWNTSSGDVLVVKRNVTYAYHNGGFQKVGRTLLDFEDATAENAGTKLGAVENAYSAPVFEVVEEGTDSLKGAKVEWAYDGSKKVYMHTFKNGEWAEGFLEDADSYPYFRMWVYNPSHIYIDMSLVLDNDVTSNYYDMSNAKLIKKDGQQITAEIGGEGGIRIPKQFEGWVVLPLDVAYLKATEGYDTVMTAFKEAKDVTIETRRVEVSENTGDAYILDEMVLDYMVVGEVKSTQDDTDYGKFDVSEKGEASLKNIIFMIGDGMGDGSLDAARLERETLYLDSLQRYGYIGTNEANDELTDSAAAGTALATGYKTLNGKVGLTADGNPVMNLSEWMLQFGKKVGLVTSSYLADATPATFASHTDSRGNYEDIWEK